jgi:hypothetical protein
METSRADTGSSHTISFGSAAKARAMAMRWRWPPEKTSITAALAASFLGGAITLAASLVDLSSATDRSGKDGVDLGRR